MTTEDEARSAEPRPVETGSLRDSAPRRTLLAAERTYLAWLRTGLGAIGVALAVGRLIPALVGGSNLAYGLLGAGYGALGIFLIAYAMLRARRIQAALAANAPVTLDWWALAVTTVLGLALAIATIAMVLAEA
jgi:putative membrane protein